MAKVKDVRTLRAKASGYFRSPVLTVRVGEEEEEQAGFTVDEHLICARSRFFRKAMRVSRGEARNRVVNLPDDNPDIFAIYLEVLYTNTIPVISKDKSYSQSKDLISLYVFAEKLMDVETKNLAMKTLLGRGRERYYPCEKQVRFAYEHTTESSLLSKMLVDIYVHQAISKDISGKRQDLPCQFVHALAKRLLDLRNDANTTTNRIPYYHPQDYMEKENELATSQRTDTSEAEGEKKMDT